MMLQNLIICNLHLRVKKLERLLKYFAWARLEPNLRMEHQKR
jgi:hypothetical protein